MANKKILVIDDDKTIVRLNQSLLKDAGYDVVAAHDGLEGVAMSTEELPDVIMLDLILPGMHGFEVCKRIRANEKTKNIPIIIVTASGLEDVAEREDAVEADAYLAKPYNIDKLEHAIKTALENKR